VQALAPQSPLFRIVRIYPARILLIASD